MPNEISAILLAGGLGKRMRSSCPKQFMPLYGKTLALFSLDVLLQCEEIKEIIVVCLPQYRSLFEGYQVHFALPGVERQDSVHNGVQLTKYDWVLTHDAARPFITADMVKSLFAAAFKAGASALAVPAKNSLKKVNEHIEVISTLDRSQIWEMQTPQLVKKELMLAGFAHAQKNGLAVTDDVALAELAGSPVKLVESSYQNIKLTTQEDLAFAQWLIEKL